MTEANKPLRGPKYRSVAFQEYLLRQDPERATQIMDAEGRFDELRKDPGSVAAAAEALFNHDLTDDIPIDKPAGVADRLDLLEEPLLPLYETSSSHE